MCPLRAWDRGLTYLTKVRLNKTSGTVNDPTHRETGLNAAILVEGGSKVTMEQCQVNSHTAMADGLTAKGQDTRVDVTEGEWQSTRNGSIVLQPESDFLYRCGRHP